MFQNNFSLLLARRYLNPVRTNLSVITLISLLGVTAGVMVLSVTLSVMNGFENLLKDIVLTSRPHIFLEHRSVHYKDTAPLTEKQWREEIKELEKKDFIKSVSPRISDYVLLDLNQKPSPIAMIGVDTNSDVEMEKFEKVLLAGDVNRLQEGDYCMISSQLSASTQLGIGHVITIYSSSNAKELMPIYKRLDSQSFYQRQTDSIKNAISFIQDDSEWVSNGLFESVSLDSIRPLVNHFILEHIEHDDSLRNIEKETLQKVFDLIGDPNAKNAASNTMEYEIGTREQCVTLLTSLSTLKVQDIDNADLRGLKEVVLPKELTIAGISKVNNFAKGTDLFVPFDIAQDLVNIDDSIQGFSINLKEPYKAGLYKTQLIEADQKIAEKYTDYQNLQKSWIALTWMESSSELFKVMDMQKFMMAFVLSFIILIAIFSISAVMFTVAIQKKREIGVMKALGATPFQIIKVFAYQGVFVGLIGSISGISLGLVVVNNIGKIQDFIRDYLKFDPFPNSIYGTDHMPTQVIPSEIVIIGVGALILCTLASLFPAWAASRNEAAKSLRNL